jgi:two-component system sensor histidine kinase/response regulator
VLIAAIRDLLVRLGESVRIANDALQLRADAFEQNVIVETSMLKSRFVAMVSHELRTPLGGIIGMAELLEREPLAERPARFTAALRTSANGLHRIVNDLLDFSRAESGKIELEDGVFDIEETLDDVVVLFREQARQRGVTLNAFVDPVLPRSIRGDQTRVKQVLHNLVSNALRFTTEGSVRIECVPGFGHETVRMLQFSVSDTGFGIAPNAIDRIFDAFVQEDPSTARRFGGTGLGLSIAKHLVELMGGRISVWSVLGAGTTFSFTLPARPADPAGVVPQSLRDTAMLVYEEHPDRRVLLQRYADGWEMRAVAAATLAEAREMLASDLGHGRTLDVVLVGAGVSEASAATFIDAVRALPASASVRAIRILEGDAAARASAVDGFDVCVAGPIRQSELFAAILRPRNTAAPQAASASRGVAARSARSERILVAEDNAVNQMLLSAQLEHLGFRVDFATDGEAAVAAALETPYDLIFMDCQMPGIDGFEATRRIRESQHAGVPIVAVTAHVLPGYRETCLAAGMSDYLAKPALIGPLTVIVDRWLPADAGRSASVPPTPAPESAPGAIALAGMRGRLDAIFHGDRERIERVIATSLDALLDGTRELAESLATHDAIAAGKIAHRLKGVALEIGSPDTAEIAQRIETAVRGRAWADAERARARLTAALELTLERDGATT